jgi:hypothetical protein
MAMRGKTVARILIGFAAAGAAVWAYGWYDAYALADKACLRARKDTSADKAKAHLVEVAARGSAKVTDDGDRTTVVFRWMFSDVAACTFRSQGGRVVEVVSGSVDRLGLRK